VPLLPFDCLPLCPFPLSVSSTFAVSADGSDMAGLAVSSGSAVAAGSALGLGVSDFGWLAGFEGGV
jgi:hypothetical protein